LIEARKKPKILCAGGAVQDIVMRVEQFPKPGGKVQASEFLITSGGQSGNAAVAIARLGADTRYTGALGDRNDKVANEIVAALEKEGIDCSAAVRVPDARSSVSTIMIDAEGEKMIATRRDSGLSDASPAEPDVLVRDVDAVLVDNRYENFSRPVCAAAAKRGIPRVVDLDKPTTPDDELLAASTHVISSADALIGTTGVNELPAGLTILGQHLKGFVAVTDGPKGVYWLDRVQGPGQVRHMPAFKVKAIDTLGAGDTFHGAFTFRLVERGDVVEAMRFASAAAAIKCTRFGGLQGAATYEEVEEFLRKNA
jgi:sugar/nucleoside kinase (ribokinase family)